VASRTVSSLLRRTLLVICALLTSILLLFCGTVTPTPSGASVTQAQAKARAEAIIEERFPEMNDVSAVEEEYSWGGSSYYSFTYQETESKQVGDQVIDVTTVVIIDIDKNTGEEIISVSD